MQTYCLGGCTTLVKRTFKERLQRCSRLMESEGIDALLLTKPSNMFYLTGDGRLCAYCMITKDGRVALGVPRTDIEDVKQLAKFDHISGFENEVGMIHSISRHFGHFGIKEGSVGLEYTFLTQSMMGMLTHPHAKPEGMVVKDCTHIMSTLRMVKDEQEIEHIEAASKVAEAGMKAAVESLKPGITESQLAAEAEYAMRYAGAEEFWRTYISSGERSNIAHGLPTNRKLKKGEAVMIDIHPVVNGYSADMCRTVCVDKPSAELQAAYDLYLRAQQAAVSKARAGVGMVELEDTLYGVIKEAGHEHHIFGPPIHGVGIEFEESPLPPGHAFFHGEKEAPPLESNMVISIGNCGLYLDDFGVRMEDTVVIGRKGPQVLTGYPRELGK